MTHYTTLGIQPTATYAKVKKAYKSLVSGLHPDKHKDTKKEELLKEINKAYNILKNAEKRETYDQSLKTGVNVDNVEVAAFQYIATSLSSIFEQDSIECSDPITSLTTTSIRNNQEIKNTLENITKKIARLKAQKKRITSTNKISTFTLQIIESNILSKENQLKELNKNLKIGEKVIELLSSMKISIEEQEKPMSAGFVTTFTI